jgi:hypothetical protein
MAKKFIINDGRIIIGDVEFHAELLRDHSKTIGGGHWFYDHLSDTMYLYGFSTEFGGVTPDQIQDAWSYSLEGRKVVYSMAIKLEDALKSTQIIHEPVKEQTQ